MSVAGNLVWILFVVGCSSGVSRPSAAPVTTEVQTDTVTDENVAPEVGDDETALRELYATYAKALTDSDSGALLVLVPASERRFYAASLYEEMVQIYNQTLQFLLASRVAQRGQEIDEQIDELDQRFAVLHQDLGLDIKVLLPKHLWDKTTTARVEEIAGVLPGTPHELVEALVPLTRWMKKLQLTVLAGDAHAPGSNDYGSFSRAEIHGDRARVFARDASGRGSPHSLACLKIDGKWYLDVRARLASD